MWKCGHKPRLRWKLLYERIWNMVDRSFLYLRLPQMSRLCLYYHKSLVFGSCCVTRLMPVSISPPPLPWKVMDSQDNSISCSLTCPHSWSVHWGDEQLRKHWFLGLSSCFWLVLLFKSNSWEWAWGCINELSPTLLTGVTGKCVFYLHFCSQRLPFLSKPSSHKNIFPKHSSLIMKFIV